MRKFKKKIPSILYIDPQFRLIKSPLMIRFFQDKHIRNGKATQNEDERSLGAGVVMR